MCARRRGWVRTTYVETHINCFMEIPVLHFPSLLFTELYDCPHIRIRAMQTN